MTIGEGFKFGGKRVKTITFVVVDRTSNEH